MNDKSKTKAQLLKELEEMRRQLTEVYLKESECRLAERELFSEKNKLQSIIDAMVSGLSIQDLSYNIIYQNEILKNIFGDRAGEKCYLVYEGNDKVCDGCPVEMAYKEGKSHTAVRSVRMPSGEIAFWENTANTIRDASGNIISCLEIARNITDRKRMEAALQESEEKYRSLASSADLMYLVDRDCRYLFMNEKYIERFGLPLDQLIGRTYGEFHSENYTRIFAEKVEEIFKTGTSFQNEHKSERDERYFLRTFSPVKSPDGKTIVAVTVVSKDINDRKQAEDLYKTLAESSLASVFIVQDGKFRYINSSAIAYAGYKAEELIGKYADTIVHSEDRKMAKQKGRAMLHGEDTAPYEFRMATKQGQIRWIMQVVSPIQYEGRPAILGNSIDITERKRAEEELIRIKKLESLGIFASGIAHDFNNLLSVMLLNIFAAKLTITDDQHEALGGGLEIAEKVGLQAKELAHHLITFANGGEPMRKTDPIAQLLMNSVDLSLSGSDIRCEYSLPDDLWPVEMDNVQIGQVIHNLVINAREAMPEGGTITVQAENVNITEGNNLPLKEGKYVKWSVDDHGIGIPKKDLEKIFDPYFTSKPTGSARGMGLGLAICYSIIKKHDGFITVESEPGIGSVFSVYLPASPQVEPLRKTETDDLAVSKKKILVMDDEETVRNATGIVLHYLGYDVEFASDGIEAIQLYRKAKETGCPFSAVILDLNVPHGMGGKEAIHELNAIDPHVKAIISCGYSDDPIVSEFRTYGFCGAVAVSYDIEKMKDILNNLLM